jgi:cysteinyl-tRNA synthetase
MSKSLGNFFTVRDLLDQGVPGEVIRFVYLMTHYRKPMDWTEEKRREAEATLRLWRGIVRGTEVSDMIDAEVVGALSDDLNTAGAIARLHAIAKSISANPKKDCHVEKALLVSSAALLGLLDPSPAWDEAGQVDLSAFVQRLTDLRAAALISKDFGPLDLLKSSLIAAGVDVRMKKEGIELATVPGFDPAKLETLK